YTSIFPNSKINQIARYGSAGPRAEGTVMTVDFELDGQRFVALNGGPDFKFTEAVSFQVSCETQEEVDEYWGKLSEGGEEGPCGWLKDRFGLSWQIVPTALPRLLADPDKEKAQRVMAAMLEMRKIEIDELAPLEARILGEADGLIAISAPENTRETSAVSADRLARLQAAYRPHTERIYTNEMSWVGCNYPTNALAQDAGMSLREYEDFL